MKPQAMKRVFLTHQIQKSNNAPQNVWDEVNVDWDRIIEESSKVGISIGNLKRMFLEDSPISFQYARANNMKAPLRFVFAVSFKTGVSKAYFMSETDDVVHIEPNEIKVPKDFIFSL